jgi:Flp pilus assembly protein TadB
MVERKDVQAALEARRELGPHYEDEIVDSLVKKIDQRLAEQQPQQPTRLERRGAITPLLLGMFGCGVAVTAILATHSSAWIVPIVWIALAYAAREIARYR